jgi:hypothetical protein
MVHLPSGELTLETVPERLPKVRSRKAVPAAGL